MRVRCPRVSLKCRGIANQAGPAGSGQKFVQEHDYTVTPSTYIYTAEANKELFERYPLLNAKSMARSKTRPKKARMLAREFIEDSMYNPNYGYFSRNAEIFSLKGRLEVENMSNIDTFLDAWSVEYRKQQRMQPGNERSKGPPAPAPVAAPGDENKNFRRSRVSRQLWHTPSELFTPYYGQSLARYIVDQHMRETPEADLVIYETGAGNGTLMKDILDFVAENHPDLYEGMQYNIIEISASLSLKQNAHSKKHGSRINIVNRSILDWNRVQEEPCFFIALEVWDNLAHDVIRYDNTSNQPYQGYVVVDENGEFTQVFSSKLEKWAKEFLECRQRIADYKPSLRLGWPPLSQPKPWRYAQNAIIPFHGNLSTPEFIPTRYFQFLHVLKKYFPRHRLLASDFTHFSERIPGYASPVVQTFIEDTPVTVPTFMVLQGYFDIMFPTDFELARRLYIEVVGGDRKVRALTHQDFLNQWVGKETVTKAGENPMVSFYRNAAFLLST